MENYAAFIAFLTLQMFGFGGGILLLITALVSPSVNRQATWFSFMFSWVLSAASYCLLLLSGNTYNANPLHALCLTQAALIYAAPALTAATTVSLVTEMYCTLRNQLSDVEVRPRRIFTAMLLGIPYLMHLAMCLGCVSISLVNPQIVRRSPNGFYCNLSVRAPSKIASISVALLLGATVCIQVATLWTLKGNWAAAKGSLMRVCAFTCFGVLASILGIVFAIGKARQPELNLALACIPTAAVLIFGTQEDVLRAWMFWKPSSRFAPLDETHFNPA